MTYLAEATNGNLYSDRLFYEGILEQLDIERDFMISCFENNIILEADAPESEKKTNWLQVILETLKRIFEKFIENTKALFKVDEKWITNNIPKLKEINFEGLNVEKVIPYWELDVNTITNTLSELQKEITNIRPQDPKLKDLQSREQVENYGKFKAFTKANSSFNEEIKKFFMIDENSESRIVSLKDNELKIKCVNEMADYVAKYNSTIVPSLQNSRRNFERTLNSINRYLNQNKPVGEAFCIIENAFYSDTELAYCINSNILTEATVSNEKNANGKAIIDLDSSEYKNVTNKNNTKNNNQRQIADPNQDNKEPKMGQVEDNSKDTNNNQNNTISKHGDTEYYNYVKNAIQLNQIAIAAAITSCERRYKLYMTILKGVVAAREPKKT